METVHVALLDDFAHLRKFLSAPVHLVSVSSAHKLVHNGEEDFQ